MTDYDIHSCGYYCNRPACIEAQRNELRDKLLAKEWVGLTEDDLRTIYASLCVSGASFNTIALVVEAKLKEKNITSERNIQTSDKETPESSQPWVKTYSGDKPNYTQPIESVDETLRARGTYSGNNP